MRPTVSVIIPFYSRIDWLEEAVQSVLAQTYKAFEIIVINDGSNEDMGDFIKSYGKKIKLFFKDNEGPGSARNIGIEFSSGDYVAFLDSDDIWLPQKLEIQISAMIDENAVWSHTSYETFTEGYMDNQSKTLVKNVAIFNGDVFPHILSSCPIATPTVVIKGDVLRNNIRFRFNNLMRYGEDSYLWLNLAVEYKIIAINEILTRVRIRGTNASLRARVQLKARTDIWEYVEQNKETFSRKKIPTLIYLAYILSLLGTKILNVCEKVIKKQSFLEYISKILYIAPWLIFKANRKR